MQEFSVGRLCGWAITSHCVGSLGDVSADALQHGVVRRCLCGCDIGGFLPAYCGTICALDAGRDALPVDAK